MNIYRFFKYFPVTLKHLAHSPKKWYSIIKTSSRFKNNGPGSSISANPLSRILKIYLSLKKKRPLFTLGCTCMVNREFG